MKQDKRVHSFLPHRADEAGVISWIHIGDLHMTQAGERNHLDLLSIVKSINAAFSSSTSFVYLPGDVADDGSAAAYAVVRGALDDLDVPWCAVLGDHDVHEKSFHNFLHAMSDETYYSFKVAKVRFIAMNAFDVAHPASFTVSSEQLRWVEAELEDATAQGQMKVLLLHCYPTDLKVGREQVIELVRKYEVRVVDMGHTHYNEIANDGGTLYTATRSTGQIEEGPVGFSITNIDGGPISWRFIELDQLPFVMITSPSDERLLTRSDSLHPNADKLRIRAKVWDTSEIARVTAFSGELVRDMQRIRGSQVWEAVIGKNELKQGVCSLRVEVENATCVKATDEIRMMSNADAAEHARPERDQDNALQAWPEHGLLGTQLGPNKNGKKW